MLQVIIAGLWGYLLGAIPTGVIVAQVLAGADVRDHGSRHTGGTNVARVAGWRGGVLTAMGDILLGAAAVGGARLLSESPWAAMAAGVMAIVGHDWSIFIGGDGGIGLADFAGALLAYDWVRGWGGVGTFVLLWPVLTRAFHVHRARSTVLALLLAVPVLGVLGMSWPGIALGAVGAAIVIIKTLPDWHRVYE